MTGMDLDPAVVRRFWAKVNRHGPVPERRPDLGPCWLWTATTNGAPGYGIFRGGEGRDKYGSRKWVLAHRYAQTLQNGPIPPGLEPDHLCFVHLCVNPSHLEPVSHRENTLRGDGPSAKQARRSSCVAGHPFDTVDKAGRRRCSVCDREKEERRYLRRYGRVAKPNSRRGRRKAAA
jgi:hypothetical protein